MYAQWIDVCENFHKVFCLVFKKLIILKGCVSVNILSWTWWQRIINSCQEAKFLLTLLIINFAPFFKRFRHIEQIQIYFETFFYCGKHFGLSSFNLIFRLLFLRFFGFYASQCIVHNWWFLSFPFFISLMSMFQNVAKSLVKGEVLLFVKFVCKKSFFFLTSCRAPKRKEFHLSHYCKFFIVTREQEILVIDSSNRLCGFFPHFWIQEFSEIFHFFYPKSSLHIPIMAYRWSKKNRNFTICFRFYNLLVFKQWRFFLLYLQTATGSVFYLNLQDTLEAKSRKNNLKTQLFHELLVFHCQTQTSKRWENKLLSDANCRIQVCSFFLFSGRIT